MASEETAPATVGEDTRDEGSPEDDAAAAAPAEPATAEAEATTKSTGTDADILEALAADEKVIFQAAKEGDLEVVAYMIKTGKVSTDVTDKDGWRPLHFAAQAGKLEIVKFLIDSNADPHAVKADSSTALHDAAYNGNVEVCQLLLDKNADINVPDEDGWTPLHYAAARGDDTAFSFLIQRGADPDAKTDDGKTVYKLAFAEGNRSIIKILEDVTDVKTDKAELQGAASARIIALEEELARVLAEKEQLQEELAKKETGKAEEPAEGEAKEGEGSKKKKNKKKKKDKAEHEDAADALDVALKTFTENAEKLDGLIVQKRAEMEEAEQGKYAPEKVEVYHEQMMQLYSLKAEDVTLESVETIPEGHTAVVPAEYQFLPVSCVVLVDVLYHPYFKDKLARQVAYISTTTHPNVAHFMGLCFKQNALQVQSAEPAAEAKGKKKKDKKPQEDKKDDDNHVPPLPYADDAVKDHEVCLVYENAGQSLQQLLGQRTPEDPLKVGQIVHIMFHIAAAVAHLHRRGHVHNAIAAATVAVDGSMTPKLTHFGVTNVSNVFRKYKIQRGPQNWYCAPEQLDPPKKNPPPMSKIYDYGSPKQDVYSMGMVLVALCTMKEEHGKPAELAKGIPWQGLRDLVYLMTKPRADDRPTAEAVVHQLAALRGAEGYTEGL